MFVSLDPPQAMLSHVFALHPCVLLLVLLLGAGGGTANAHAVLIEARPADGERLEVAPTELVLRFNEPVTALAVRLLDRQGVEIEDLVVQERGDTLVINAPEGLPAGAYFLSYRVASLDAHAVGATLRFGIGVAPVSTIGVKETDAAVSWAALAARWLFYVASLGALGGALFIGLVRPPEPLSAWSRQLTAQLALLGLIAGLLRLGTTGLNLAGLPMSALLTPQPWRTVVVTTLGPASLLAGAGLVLLVLGRMTWWRLALAATALAFSFALTGHAASAAPRWLMAPAIAIHVLCAGFWLGSLLPLVWSLRLPPATAAVVLRRFSLLAMAAVLVLTALGVAIAYVQLGASIEALTATAYGWRLVAKLALVALLLSLAVLNRTYFSARAAAGQPKALRGSLFADLGLGLAVLAITASFPLSPPPRALAAADAQTLVGEEITVVAAGRGGQATFTLLPGRMGSRRLTAWVTDLDGAPIRAREAAIRWSLPTGGLEPFVVAVDLPAPGVIAAADLDLPRPGRWQLRLELLIDDFTKLSFEAELAVP
jgi:copper transport protein